ncbi:MAG: hypothetical protein IPK16_10030 [Anaerolineales bacterium]|nr:hypothetical protein [Anaerolineales bacterium]
MQQYDDALGASRATLRAAINETNEVIERALLDDAIDEDRRAKYLSVTELVSVKEVRDFKALLVV